MFFEKVFAWELSLLNINKNGINEDCNCDSLSRNGVRLVAGNAGRLSEGTLTNDEG